MRPTLPIVIAVGLAGDDERLRVLAPPQRPEILLGQILYASLTLRDKPPGWLDVLAMPVPRGAPGQHNPGSPSGLRDLPDLVRTLPLGLLTDP